MCTGYRLLTTVQLHHITFIFFFFAIIKGRYDPKNQIILNSIRLVNMLYPLMHMKVPPKCCQTNENEEGQALLPIAIGLQSISEKLLPDNSFTGIEL